MARLGKVYPFPEIDWTLNNYDDQTKALESLQAASDALPDGGVVGALLSFPVADGSALYVVTKASPLTVSPVPYMDSYQVSRETLAGINLDTVKTQLAWRKTWNNHARDGDDFFESLTPGQIVHYDNGFNEFVRCEVTEDHKFRPIAIVGEWREYDRTITVHLNGYRSEPYYYKKIRDNDAWRPNAGCVYESPSYTKKGNASSIDPTDLTPWAFETVHTYPKLQDALDKIRESFPDAEAIEEDGELIIGLGVRVVNGELHPIELVPA